MTLPIRLLIDYATGENWEMPKELYDQYLVCVCGKKHFSSTSQTFIQQWMEGLKEVDRLQIVKKLSAGKKVQ